MDKKTLSAKTKFWFGIGDFGFNLMTNVETFQWNAWLTQAANFSVTTAGLISTVASTIDACLSWIYGGLMNMWKPGKYGRYRTWLIKISWLAPIIYAFQFIRVSNNDTVAAIVCCAAAVISHVVWNFGYVANVTMISVASQGVPENKAALASSRGTWNNLASVIFSYALVGLTAILPESLRGDKTRIGIAAFVFGLVMVAGLYVHFKITDGLEEIEDPNAPKAVSKSATPKDMGRAIAGNAQLLLLIVVDLAKWIVKFLVSSAAVYYFLYTNGTGLQANYVMFANIAAVAGAFLARFLGKKLTNRGAMIVSMAWLSALMIISYFMFSNVNAVFWIMILGQVGYGVAYAISPALYADVAVYDRWKHGKDTTGFIMGLQNLPLKAAVMVKSVLLNAALGFAGYEAVRQQITAEQAAGTLSAFTQTLDPSLKQGVCAAFTLFPALFCIVGLLILIFGYKLTKEKVAECQAEIDAREV